MWAHRGHWGSKRRRSLLQGRGALTCVVPRCVARELRSGNLFFPVFDQTNVVAEFVALVEHLRNSSRLEHRLPERQLGGGCK